jgi:hypothetical protein
MKIIKLPFKWRRLLWMSLATALSISLFAAEKASGVGARTSVESVLLSPIDFRDSQEFARKLIAHSDVVSQWIWSEMPTQSREALQSRTVSRLALAESLASELNTLITNRSIYNRVRFATIPLRPGLQQFAERRLDAAGAACINRIVLQEAYPDDISPRVGIVLEDKSERFAIIGPNRRILSLFGFFRDLVGNSCWRF